MVIKGTGNSRFLKTVANALTLYPTWEAAVEAMIAGTFPIDLNGVNPAGWDVQGDKLNKATLLTDALCTALGLAATATPTQAMEKLRQLVATAQGTADGKGNVEFYTGQYTGIGTYRQDKSLTFPKAPFFVAIAGGSYYFFALRNNSNAIWMQPGGNRAPSAVWNGKTFTWNAYDDAHTQMNLSGLNYYYFALTNSQG